MYCLYGGYNLHRISDALGLVNLDYPDFMVTLNCNLIGAMAPIKS